MHIAGNVKKGYALGVYIVLGPNCNIRCRANSNDRCMTLRNMLLLRQVEDVIFDSVENFTDQR